MITIDDVNLIAEVLEKRFKLMFVTREEFLHYRLEILGKLDRIVGELEDMRVERLAYLQRQDRIDGRVSDIEGTPCVSKYLAKRSKN